MDTTQALIVAFAGIVLGFIATAWLYERRLHKLEDAAADAYRMLGNERGGREADKIRNLSKTRALHGRVASTLNLPGEILVHLALLLEQKALGYDSTFGFINVDGDVITKAKLRRMVWETAFASGDEVPVFEADDQAAEPKPAAETIEFVNDILGDVDIPIAFIPVDTVGNGSGD